MTFIPEPSESLHASKKDANQFGERARRDECRDRPLAVTLIAARRPLPLGASGAGGADAGFLVDREQ